MVQICRSEEFRSVLPAECYSAIALSLMLSLLRGGDGMKIVAHFQDFWAIAVPGSR